MPSPRGLPSSARIHTVTCFGISPSRLDTSGSMLQVVNVLTSAIRVIAGNQPLQLIELFSRHNNWLCIGRVDHRFVRSCHGFGIEVLSFDT